MLERAKGSREKLKTPEWGGGSSVINGAGRGPQGTTSRWGLAL